MERLNTLARSRIELRVLFPLLGLAVLLAFPSLSSNCIAQTSAKETGRTPDPGASASPSPTTEYPQTDRERAMLEVIKKIQERVTKLEKAQI